MYLYSKLKLFFFKYVDYSIDYYDRFHLKIL